MDKFHLMKMLNGAVDEGRRREIRPTRNHLNTALAYRIKRSFQEFWSRPTDLAETFLKRWYYWATHSQLDPVIRVAK